MSVCDFKLSLFAQTYHPPEAPEVNTAVWAELDALFQEAALLLHAPYVVAPETDPPPAVYHPVPGDIGVRGQGV